MSLIYYAGQDVGVTSPVVVNDAGGTPVGSVVVSLTVTDPSGAVTTPATVATGTGAYSAVVPSAALAGVWRYRWNATATATLWVAEGQFQVRPAGIEQLVDLASVKAHLNMPATDTRQDDELQGFILAAADLARYHCGPFLPETHTQFFDGYRPTIVPDWRPLISVLSCTEYYGLSAYLLTEQPLDGQQNAFAFTADYQTGQITRRTFGGGAGLFAAGDKNIKLVYTAGRKSVPFTVRLGTLELIRHLWQLTQQGGRPKFGSAGSDSSDSVVPTGFALPLRVIELWSPERRPPGIA
jgi:hypothetical protein